MSPRAASRLETLGFREVYEYTPGKQDWLAAGLPREGRSEAIPYAGDVASAEVATFPRDAPLAEAGERIEASPHSFGLVLDEHGIVLGRVRAEDAADREDGAAEDVMDPGPVTLRANQPAEAVAQALRGRGLHTALVTTPEGRLIGILDAAEVLAEGAPQRRS